MPTTVILGTGIIGLSTAYYLSRFTSNDDTPTPSTLPSPSVEYANVGGTQEHEIHLVEASPELFTSASGKAAGFLAKDWFAPAVASLGEFSFDLHRQLAEEQGGRELWGWSESTSYSMDRDDSEDEEQEEADDVEQAEAIPHPSTTDGDADPTLARPVGHSSNGSRSHKNDLGWLMDGSSRATLLYDPSAGVVADEEEEDDDDDDGDDGDEDELPQWLFAKRSALQVISDRTSTGQVDPYRLCQFLLQECLARGVKLHQPARATELIQLNAEEPRSASIRLEFSAVLSDKEARGTPASSSAPLEPASESSAHETSANEDGRASATIEIPCDNVVIAAGCWTPKVYSTLFPNAGRIPQVAALAGHSLVLKSARWPPKQRKKFVFEPFSSSDSLNSIRPSPSSSETDTTASAHSTGSPHGSHAVFTGDPAGYSPEIFSRLTGDIWLGGLNSSAIPLPSLATQAEQLPDSIDVLTRTARALCGPDVEIVRTGLCFRPVAPTGRPVIARMHEADLGDGAKVPGGVYVATGHGPWGISLSLGTGHVVSEMVLGRPPSADLSVLGKWEAQGP